MKTMGVWRGQKSLALDSASPPYYNAVTAWLVITCKHLPIDIQYLPNAVGGTGAATLRKMGSGT